MVHRDRNFNSGRFNVLIKTVTMLKDFLATVFVFFFFLYTPLVKSQGVVTLSPHLAELVYSAGAGEDLIAVSAWSNYPESVKSLPVIGDAFHVDIEKILALKPDLILAWGSGTSPQLVSKLRQYKLNIKLVDQHVLQDIPLTIRQIGQWCGTSSEAEKSALEFESKYQALLNRYQSKRALKSVFIQTSSQVLFTVNQHHLMSELIMMCGGENIFASLEQLSSRVEEEAVLKYSPEWIILPSKDAASRWREWQKIGFLENTRLMVVNPDHFHRATTRILLSAEKICENLKKAN